MTGFYTPILHYFILSASSGLATAPRSMGYRYVFRCGTSTAYGKGYKGKS